MKKIFLPLILLFLILNTSCEQLEGDWDDNIKLSSKVAAFSVEGDSVTIKTGGNSWWINNITVNNKAIWYSLPELADSTSYTLNLDSIVVERREKNTLFVKAMTNKLNTKRKIIVCLEAGNYFDYVTITQNGY